MKPDVTSTLCFVVLIIAMAVCVTIIHDIMRDLEASRNVNRTLFDYLPKNAYAHYLGKEVWSKVYEASEWERSVVVAVSWHGSVCVRPVSDLERKGRWIHHAVERGRIRTLDAMERDGEPR